MENKGFFELVYDEVRRIPKGRVTTYGRIAAAVGSPRAARQVGWALHCNPDNSTIPCHRVVNRFGACATAFAFGGSEVQRQMLESEGVQFYNGCVREEFFI